MKQFKFNEKQHKNISYLYSFVWYCFHDIIYHTVCNNFLYNISFYFAAMLNNKLEQGQEKTYLNSTIIMTFI